MDNFWGFVILGLIVIAIGYGWYQKYVAHDANQAIRRMERRDRNR